MTLDVTVPEPTAAFVTALHRRRVATSTPTPRPVPNPSAAPQFAGSRFLIWKQDPTVSALGARTVYVPNFVLNGPRDARFETVLANTTPVTKNALGDFVFPPGTPELDCSHTFAVVRQTLNLVQRALDGQQVPWAWNNGSNTDPISVHPRAGVTPNAYYSRTERALKFFYFSPAGASTPVYTCRSLDITAHECGHAILDGLKPSWLAGSGNSAQTGGLHESFGDLCALFLALSQLDQVEAFIATTRGDLHAKNFLAALAEEFGAALGLPLGLRNADNDFKLSQVSTEVHAISQIFTGGVYDFLADLFAHETARQKNTKDPGQVLLEVSQQVFKLVLKGIIAAPNIGATYADVVNAMLSASKAAGQPAIYRTFLRNRFTLREVVVSSVPLHMQLLAAMDFANQNLVIGNDDEPLKASDEQHPSLIAPHQDRSNCCGTMLRPEFALAKAIQLAGGAAVSDEELLQHERETLKRAFNGKKTT